VKDIVWGDILSIGVDEIDDDHRKLISTFNLLNRAVLEGESNDYLAAILEELINCTVWHFSHEERLMLKYRYGDAEAHKDEHRELIATAKELQHEILQGHGDMTEEHLGVLERWLTEHILTSDMRLGDFLCQAS
jgi:hemerythrin-like metal-binding protein